MTDYALSFTNLSLTLGTGPDRTDALVDINLDVAPGELVAVTGRSGSGKSSLLNVAGGLVAPSSGTVVAAGVDLGALDANGLAEVRRRSVGYVFQDLNLIPSLTAVENVSLPLELDGRRVAAARAEALTSLQAVGLEAIADRYPGQLSGGQRQRVAIAGGLVGDRRILLADEPTGALDDITAEDIMRLLRKQCDLGAATLLVTHDLTLAAWADRVVKLRDGRIDTVAVSPAAVAGGAAGAAASTVQVVGQ